MINTAHPQARAWRPSHPVIEGTRAETGSNRTGEDSCDRSPTRPVSTHDQQWSDDERDEERNLMQHTPEYRFRKRS